MGFFFDFSLSFLLSFFGVPLLLTWSVRSMNAPVSFLLPAPQLSSPASQNSQSLILGGKVKTNLLIVTGKSRFGVFTWLSHFKWFYRSSMALEVLKELAVMRFLYWYDSYIFIGVIYLARKPADELSHPLTLKVWALTVIHCHSPDWRPICTTFCSY